MDETSANFLKDQTLIDAYRKNIQNEDLAAAMEKEAEGEKE